MEDDGGSLGITPDGKKNKKGVAMDIGSPGTPSSSMAVVVKRASPAKNAAYGIVILLYSHACMFTKFIQDTQHCIVQTDVPTTVAMKTAHQPAYLCSFRLPTPKAAIALKVTLALSELGISHSRLVMPTRENVTQFESLLDATTALIEIKRLVDKADYDIKVSRNRLGVRAKSQSAGDREPRIENDDGMDINTAQANGDVNRDIGEGN